MKKTIIIFLLLLTGIDTYAQSAHWTCDDHAFEYSMTAYIQIQSGDALIDNLEDFEVATFCGDECRGVATVLDNPNCYYLRLRSNSTDGETMVVKCYSRSRNIEYPATATILFTADQLYNYPSSPLVIDLGALDAMVNVPIDGNGSVTGAGEHYTHTTVTLTATPDYGYHFEGWIEGEDTLSVDTAYEFTLTANRTIAAHFAPNVHNVRFVANDIEFQSDNLAFGSPIVPPTQVSITGHTFKGWQDVPAAMPDSDIVIIGTFTPNRYALIYIVDGEEVKSDSITYATDITPLPEPVKKGHTFSGWSEIPATMPAQDVIIEGWFVINRYILTYIVDGKLVQRDSVTFNAPITPLAEPNKEGYTFSGWSEIPKEMPDSDVVVTGVFTINSHFVYYYVEGNVWHRDSLTYGALIAPPSQTPVKDGYTFTGWSGLVETLPDSDVTAVAQFSKNPLTVFFTKDVSVMLTPGQVNKITIDRDTVTAFAANMGYDISHLRLQFYADEEHKTLVPVGSGNWISSNGVLTTQEVAPLFVSITTDENTVTLTNTNNKSLVKVGDKYDVPVFITDTTGTRAYQVNIGVTIIAERYAVNYFVDGEFYQADSLAYNVPVTLIANPIREGYTFSGWSEPPTKMPAADVTVTGSFSINSYKLTYIVDGEVYKADSVAFATELQSEPQPEKEGYTFSGWSEFPATMPSHDVTVTGTFTVNSYILRYYVDGEAYDSISVTYGEAIVPIAEPTREGKTFSGWIGVPETMPAHDVNVAGTFATDMYLVTFIIDGDVLKADSVTFGLPIEAPTPEREGYTFSGWSEIPSTMPAHDVTITGSFAINSYKLTYIVDGEEYKADSVTYATTLTPLSEPTKEGYTFSGWSEIPVTMPAHDVSIIGTFKVNPTHETEDAVLAYDEEKGGYEFTGIKEPENKETTVPREVNGIPVVSVPEGTFAGNTQMQVLTWDSEASVDAKCFDEPEEHGNLLVFVSSDANVSYEGNVIRCIQMPDSTTRYEAEKIALYDGRPITNPVPFTAKYISITKEFSKETIIGSTSGWETIVVPFDVDSITTEDGQLIAPFGSDALTNRHFWLAKMDIDAGFVKVTRIRANVPYIISMPNNERYTEEYRISGKVTFHGTNVEVQPTANATSNAGPLFGLVPTYQEVAAADSVFVLNDEPYEADGITWPAGSVFVRSIRAARPFEAYTYANASNGGNVKGYIPLDEMATGIKGINQWSMVNGQWSIANGAGAIYDLSGRRIAGSGSLKKGLYIESGQKVLVK